MTLLGAAFALAGALVAIVYAGVLVSGAWAGDRDTAAVLVMVGIGIALLGLSLVARAGVFRRRRARRLSRHERRRRERG